MREMVLRDRNHPSVTIWGLLNETFDGPVFRHAVDSLPLVRALDADAPGAAEQRALGLPARHRLGVSNPGSAEWEHVWGAEAPGAPAASSDWNRQIGGYFDRAGDAHVYPAVPHPPEIVRFLRTLGQRHQAGLPVRVRHRQPAERHPRTALVTSRRG